VSHIPPRSEVRHLSMQCLPFRFNDLVRKSVRCCGHASSWASIAHRCARERGGHSAAEAARVHPLRRGGKHVPTFERSKTTTAKTVGILGEVAEAARMPPLQFRTSAADQADGPICRTELLRCKKQNRLGAGLSYCRETLTADVWYDVISRQRCCTATLTFGAPSPSVRYSAELRT